VSILADAISLAIGLAINLLLIGLVVAGGTATAFRFIRTTSPRLRYVVAVTAFVVATFGPLTVTSRGLFKQSSPITVIEKEDAKFEVARNSSSGPEAGDLPGVSALNQTTSLPDMVFSELVLYLTRSGLGWLFAGLWVGVAGCLLWREIAGHLQLENERKRWQIANAEQREEFFCPAEVTLYFAEYGSFAAGFWSPAIVLPRRFPDNLCRSSIRGIVLHEIAHAKWRDPFVNSLVRAVRALF